MTTYDFPNATIKKFSREKYIEIPKWCPMISVDRSREYVLCALRQLKKLKHESRRL